MDSPTNSAYFPVKLSSDAYQFEVTLLSEGGLVLRIKQTSTGQVREFYKKVGHAYAMFNHACSLTDELCEQWFKAQKQGKKKK